MSFCINCGSVIKNQSAKFCFKCGARIEIEEASSSSTEIENKPISDIKTELEMPKSNSSDIGNKAETLEGQVIKQSPLNGLESGNEPDSSERKIMTNSMEKMENPNMSAHELGKLFEDMVENILKYQNYSTSRNVWLAGTKGRSEIDILAKRTIKGSEEKLAVECKNYESRVSVDVMRVFHEKLEDLQIKNGLVAVYKGFSQDASKWGQSCGFELWDGETIRNKFFELQVGRLKKGEVADFEYCLPITIDFEKVTKLSFNNAKQVDLIEAKIIWKPFYKIWYKVNCVRTDPSKKQHFIEDSGYLICDAMSENRKKTDSTVTNVMKTIGLLNRTEEERKENKEDSIILKLLEQEPAKNISLSQSEEYRIIKLKPVVTESTAKERVINTVIENNTRTEEYWRNNETILDAKNFKVAPNSKDIRIMKTQLIFVPKWEIEYKSKDYKYVKIISANDGSIIFDNVTYCNEHWSIGLFQKKNIAVCDVCGKASCADHISKCPLCGSWRCQTHSKQCIGCRMVFCTDHIHGECDECKALLCEACSIKCPICGEIHCKNHVTKCDKCSRKLCVSCTKKEGSIFSKKTICKECSGLKT